MEIPKPLHPADFDLDLVKSLLVSANRNRQGFQGSGFRV